MSWSNGSRLFSRIIEDLGDEVTSTSTRESIYKLLIPLFEDEDCDTLDECLGLDPAFDTVFNDMYPEYSSEEDDEEIDLE
jgi:hypothetical protein